MNADLKIKCIYCEALWTGNMEMTYAGSTEGCDTCGHGAVVTAEIIIRCENCHRVVYKKELSSR